MARKSRKVDYVNVGNKENLVTEAENQCEKVSHAALYAKRSSLPYFLLSDLWKKTWFYQQRDWVSLYAGTYQRS